jgi:hypothetical protein
MAMLKGCKAEIRGLKSRCESVLENAKDTTGRSSKKVTFDNPKPTATTQKSTKPKAEFQASKVKRLDNMTAKAHDKTFAFIRKLTNGKTQKETSSVINTLHKLSPQGLDALVAQAQANIDATTNLKQSERKETKKTSTTSAPSKSKRQLQRRGQRSANVNTTAVDDQDECDDGGHDSHDDEAMHSDITTDVLEAVGAPAARQLTIRITLVHPIDTSVRVTITALVDTGATNTVLAKRCLPKGIILQKSFVRLKGAISDSTDPVFRVYCGVEYEDCTFPALYMYGFTTEKLATRHEAILGLDWLRQVSASIRLSPNVGEDLLH